MPVDLIQSDASLQKLLHNNSYAVVVGMYDSQTDKHMALRVLSYLNEFEIKINYFGQKNFTHEFGLDQENFFKWCDLIAQLIINSGCLDEPINKVDIYPCRIRLAATRRGTLEINRLMAIHGINDNNCYIDNYESTIRFNTDSFKSFIRITNVAMEHHIC